MRYVALISPLIQYLILVMINQYAQTSEDKVSQYLEETRDYIERLKNNLISKILIEQQTKKNGKDLIDLNADNGLSVTRGNLIS